ncbi:uncharacterized protein LOC112349851 isoform X2 [Selaginella moellendorffii]|uniref:uncharacterized protein LOC112349851 isoform X2 n=1 Tax=Selaginella moellendorffii TaxID=88036 RepID=UPI000D1C417D|nr:uncharacterized protein LOC112349851 isoform X2 [Selaginella moellendorffii]|eukprot:XP_024540751.1 uncharacterized protein LOC112349851 isoform X2 [Selaginella moellendorffii]
MWIQTQTRVYSIYDRQVFNNPLQTVASLATRRGVTSGSKARIRHTRVGTTGTKLISSNGEQMEGEKARRVGLHVVNKTMRINVKNSQTDKEKEKYNRATNKVEHCEWKIS